MAFLSLMLRPWGWDGQEGMRQQSGAGWNSLQRSGSSRHKMEASIAL